MKSYVLGFVCTVALVAGFCISAEDAHAKKYIVCPDNDVSCQVTFNDIVFTSERGKGRGDLEIDFNE